MIRNPNILVIDDHQPCRRALKKILTTFNFATNLYEAASTIEAVSIFRKNIIDLVLLDIKMQGVDPAYTIKHVLDLAPKTKVIVLVQFNMEPFIFHFLSFGANGYLLKSSGAHELEKSIAATLESTDPKIV